MACSKGFPHLEVAAATALEEVGGCGGASITDASFKKVSLGRGSTEEHSAACVRARWDRET